MRRTVELFENSFNSVIGAHNISPATLIGQLLIAGPSDGGYGAGTSSIGGLVCCSRPSCFHFVTIAEL